MVPELFGILAKLGIHSGRISFSPTTLNILISSDISTTLSTFMGPSFCLKPSVHPQDTRSCIYSL